MNPVLTPRPIWCVLPGLATFATPAELAGPSWEIHEYALSLASGDRLIVVLMPDASYGWSGIEELIDLRFIDKRTGKWGDAIRDRSPLHPIEFISRGPFPSDTVVVQPILVSPGQKPPDTTVGCRSWINAL
jgi:hypothetical protein